MKRAVKAGLASVISAVMVAIPATVASAHTLRHLPNPRFW